MTQIILKILNWIRVTFFEKDIIPVKPPVAPIAPVAPIPMPTPIIPSKTKLELWIEAITTMEGAKPSRNNPGNLRFIGQKYAVNDNGFCKFDTLDHGKSALSELLTNACTGKSSVYHPTMTLLEFQNKYSPASDGNDPVHYAMVVADHIHTLYPEITIDTEIKYFII